MCLPWHGQDTNPDRGLTVNFCKKCSEMRRNNCFSPHSPQSPHFLQKFTKKTSTRLVKVCVIHLTFEISEDAQT